MLKISSFLQNNHSDLILLNKNLYAKVIFIEQDVANQELLKIVDNNDFFTLLYCNSKSSRCLGSSLNIRSVFFINNLNIKIKFFLKVSFFPNIYNNFLKSVHKVIFCLDKLKQLPHIKKHNSLIFLNTVRSGFKVVYYGIIGFFPHSSFTFLFLKIINSQFLKDFFYVLFVKNFYSKFILRLNFSKINVEYRLLYLKKKKFAPKSKKYFSQYTDVNFFFLNPKQKKLKVFLQNNFNRKNK